MELHCPVVRAYQPFGQLNQVTNANSKALVETRTQGHKRPVPIAYICQSREPRGHMCACPVHTFSKMHCVVPTLAYIGWLLVTVCFILTPHIKRKNKSLQQVICMEQRNEKTLAKKRVKHTSTVSNIRARKAKRDLLCENCFLRQFASLRATKAKDNTVG